MTKEHRMNSTLQCPGCGSKLDGAFNPYGGDVGPSDGDATLCAYCRSMGVFRGDPVDRITRPTLEEEAIFLADPQIQRTIMALRMANE